METLPLLRLASAAQVTVRRKKGFRNHSDSYLMCLEDSQQAVISEEHKSANSLIFMIHRLKREKKLHQSVSGVLRC